VIHNFKNTESWEDRASNTQKLSNSNLASHPLFIFTPHFSAFTINTLQSLPLWKFHTFPIEKCLEVDILNWFSHVLMGIHETINNNQDLKHKICFKFHPFNYKNIAYKSIQPEICFGKL